MVQARPSQDIDLQQVSWSEEGTVKLNLVQYLEFVDLSSRDRVSDMKMSNAVLSQLQRTCKIWLLGKLSQG